MRRSLSVALVISLLATIVVPVWALQPAPQSHATSIGIAHEADHGFKDWWRRSRVVRLVGQGCALYGAAALVSGGLACTGPGAWICGTCAVYAVIEVVVGGTD